MENNREYINKVYNHPVKEGSKNDFQEEYDGNHQEVTADENLVNSPSHYTSCVKGLNIEAIDCMRAAFGDEDVSAFCICNALKYLFRHKLKGGTLDIKKAAWYINKYLELHE